MNTVCFKKKIIFLLLFGAVLYFQILAVFSLSTVLYVFYASFISGFVANKYNMMNWFSYRTQFPVWCFNFSESLSLVCLLLALVMIISFGLLDYTTVTLNTHLPTQHPKKIKSNWLVKVSLVKVRLDYSPDIQK